MGYRIEVSKKGGRGMDLSFTTASVEDAFWKKAQLVETGHTVEVLDEETGRPVIRPEKPLEEYYR